MKNKEILLLTEKLRNFSEERDWAQFLSPKNLVMALAGEVGELTEHFQWLSEDESYLLDNEETLKEVKEELADVFLYLLQVSDKLNVDLLQSANEKFKVNEAKYPIHLSKGSSKKYTKL